LEQALKKGTVIEDALENGSWKEFEEFCEAVLQEHGWKTKRNYRFKTENRYEIDVIAIKGDKILAVDCKHWGIRPGKKYQIISAIKKQNKRAEEFKKIKFFMDMDKKRDVYPLIVTWFEEDVLNQGQTFVVPASKLNTFLLEIDSYI